MADYVHFYYASAPGSTRLPPPEAFTNLLAWSDHLGVQGWDGKCERVKRQLSGKTKWLPILWCSENIYKILAQPLYSSEYDAANVRIPANWLDSHQELRGDLTNVQKSFCHTSPDGKRLNIVIVNLDDFFRIQSQRNIAFQELLIKYRACNKAGFYSLAKDCIIPILLAKSGFYFDVDISPTTFPFVFSHEQLRRPIERLLRTQGFGADEGAAVILDLLKFNENFNKLQAAATRENDVSDYNFDWEYDVGMQYKLYKTCYLANTSRVLLPADLENKITQQLESAKKEEIYSSRVAGEEFRQVRELYKNKGIKAISSSLLSGAPSYRDCTRIKRTGLDIAHFLFNMLKIGDLGSSIITRARIRLERTYLNFYLDHFFNLFQQKNVRVPCSLNLSNYRQLQQEQAAALTIQRRYTRYKINATTAENVMVPINTLRDIHHNTTIYYGIYKFFGATIILPKLGWRILLTGKHTLTIQCEKSNYHICIQFQGYNAVHHSSSYQLIEYDAGKITQALNGVLRLRMVARAFEPWLMFGYQQGANPQFLAELAAELEKFSLLYSQQHTGIESYSLSYDDFSVVTITDRYTPPDPYFNLAKKLAPELRKNYEDIDDQEVFLILQEKIKLPLLGFDEFVRLVKNDRDPFLKDRLTQFLEKIMQLHRLEQNASTKNHLEEIVNKLIFHILVLKSLGVKAMSISDADMYQIMVNQKKYIIEDLQKFIESKCHLSTRHTLFPSRRHNHTILLQIQQMWDDLGRNFS